MKLHIVGGFLGSGKTTAIIQVARVLLSQGLKVGIITNDQGKYLVDTAFFRLNDFPTVEVNGGCFCCNYNDLDDRLEQLKNTVHPDAIFAESVGSCADIVATVVKPLLKLGHNEITPASFSVFCDARLLLRRLTGQDMPFKDDIVYIFDKQIEEAGILVINKIDLLHGSQKNELLNLASTMYPGKNIRFQTSLNPDGVIPWLQQIQNEQLGWPQKTLDIDYGRYSAGEAQLAWVDLDLNLSFPQYNGKEQLRNALKNLLKQLASRRAAIGHIKFMINNTGNVNSGVKISLPTLEEPGWEEQIPEIEGRTARLMVNARVEMPADDLRKLIETALIESGIGYEVFNENAFHPPQPKPTYRIN